MAVPLYNPEADTSHSHTRPYTKCGSDANTKPHVCRGLCIRSPDLPNRQIVPCSPSESIKKEDRNVPRMTMTGAPLSIFTQVFLATMASLLG